MHYCDIKQINTSIARLSLLGAHVSIIGSSGQGRPMYGVLIGNHLVSTTLLLIAGLHANEIIGPLAAVTFLEQVLNHPYADYRIACVPVADPDFLDVNSSDLPNNATMRDVLKLRAFRDLEGEFTSSNTPECQHIQHWLKGIGPVDAYISLHTAHRIAPGLFFYVADTASHELVMCIKQRLIPHVPVHIPFAEHDPTSMAQAVLSDGFFRIPLHQDSEEQTEPLGASLAYVQQHFQPKFIAATETPLGISAELVKASIEHIEAYNRKFAETGNVEHPFHEIPVDEQVKLTTMFIHAAIQCL